MSTLTEIQEAVARLSDDDKRRLLRTVVESLPQGLPTPEPRTFTLEQMQAWIEADERDYREFLAKRKLESASACAS